MVFSLNQNEILIEVLFDNCVIDSFSKHPDVDFKYYCIVGDLDTKCGSYHTSRVLIDHDNDPEYDDFRLVIDDDAYKKSITNNSNYCCVYVSHFGDLMEWDLPYDKCDTAIVYNSSGKLASFEGQHSRSNSHNFTFLQSKDSNNGSNKPYLIAATNKGLQVFNLTDIENSNILWEFSPIFKIGITPLTNSGKKYFVVCVEGHDGGKSSLYFLNPDRFVNEVYQVNPCYTDIFSILVDM